MRNELSSNNRYNNGMKGNGEEMFEMMNQESNNHSIMSEEDAYGNPGNNNANITNNLYDNTRMDQEISPEDAKKGLIIQPIEGP